jgi:hypothetical protein
MVFSRMSMSFFSGALFPYYARTLALVWILKTLVMWLIVLEAPLPSLFAFLNTQPLSQMTLPHQATLLYFAVMDAVAAVGLWFLSSWGGIVWLLVVVSHGVLAVLNVLPFGVSVVLWLLLSLITLGYLVLSWQNTNHEPRHASPH